MNRRPRIAADAEGGIRRGARANHAGGEATGCGQTRPERARPRTHAKEGNNPAALLLKLRVSARLAPMAEIVAPQFSAPAASDAPGDWRRPLAERRRRTGSGRLEVGRSPPAQRRYRDRNDLRHDERREAHADNDRPHGRCWRRQLHHLSHRRQVRRRRQQPRA